MYLKKEKKKEMHFTALNVVILGFVGDRFLLLVNHTLHLFIWIICLFFLLAYAIISWLRTVSHSQIRKTGAKVPVHFLNSLEACLSNSLPAVHILGTLGSLPMDKGVPPSLFVNDGSFMERFKQLQQEKEKEKSAKLEDSKPIKIKSGSLTANSTISRTSLDKTNDTQKKPQASSGGKLAFSLKQKSKIVAPPVKLADEDEDETDAGKVSADVPTKRLKLDHSDASEHSSRQVDVGNYWIHNNYFILLGCYRRSADLLVFWFTEEQN